MVTNKNLGIYCKICDCYSKSKEPCTLIKNREGTIFIECFCFICGKKKKIKRLNKFQLKLLPDTLKIFLNFLK